MKLYTEEQVRMILDNLQTHVEEKFDYYIDEVIDEIIPIQLPSDEEIANKADDYVENDHILFVTNSRNSKRYGFADGAKWMRDKIQGGNK